MASETTHTETQVAADAAHSGAFPPFDPTSFGSQLLWLAITFGVLYYVMSKVALPRIGEILETRRDRIAGDLSEAERLKRETDEAIASYEQALAEAKAKAHGIAQDARERVKADIDARNAAAGDELAGKMADAENRISAMKTEAMAEVGSIAEETAAAIVSELAGSADASAISGAVKAAGN
ncbi:F0F1 ATP synthase subunit B [Coralliovum pocilloporae]|uniref:F0F1 ATP synthase subunit B n=1 Tax=Coralliovum pocilloporae TaxID=3066369 RepID=UPI0033077142